MDLHSKMTMYITSTMTSPVNKTDSGKTIHSAEKNDASYERATFFTEMKQRKVQMARLYLLPKKGSTYCGALSSDKLEYMDTSELH